MHFAGQKIIPFLLLLSISACATVPDEVRLLDSTLRTYEGALRWQNYDLAKSLYKDEKEPFTPAELKRLKRYKIAEYTVVMSRVEPDNRHAMQIINIKYFIEDVVILREMRITNKWEYDEKTKAWWLTSPFPEFR